MIEYLAKSIKKWKDNQGLCLMLTFMMLNMIHSVQFKMMNVEFMFFGSIVPVSWCAPMHALINLEKQYVIIIQDVTWKTMH